MNISRKSKALRGGLAAAAALAGSAVVAVTAQAHAAEVYGRTINLTYTIDAYAEDHLGGGFRYHAYRVQLLQTARWDGTHAWFTSAPDFRAYPVSSGLIPTPTLTSDCTITGQSLVNAKAPSVRATCRTTITNKDPLFTTWYRPAGRADGRSDFKLLNNGGSATRYYTLVLDANGCVNVSGVGQGSACQ